MLAHEFAVTKNAISKYVDKLLIVSHWTGRLGGFLNEISYLPFDRLDHVNMYFEMSD